MIEHPNKTSFRIKKEGKDENGKRKIIFTEEIVEIPPEFRIQASDVPLEIREDILKQGELSLKTMIEKFINNKKKLIKF